MSTLTVADEIVVSALTVQPGMVLSSWSYSWAQFAANADAVADALGMLGMTASATDLWRAQ
jgi:hypothetical protein